MNHLTPAERLQLDEVGCLILTGLIEPALLTELRATIDRLFAEEGCAAGSEFKQESGCGRLANLVDKDPVFQRVIRQPKMLAAVGHVLAEDFKLSSLNARTAYPHNGQRQPWHCDMGAVPDDRGFWVCNAIWLLDEFTPQNGATRFLPGSHLKSRLPQDELSSLTDDQPRQQLVTGSAGSIAIMNAHVWHGGLENQTCEPRRAIHVFFVRRDKPQQQYQKRLLSQRTQDSLDQVNRQLLALDDPLNDSLSVGVEPRSGFLK